MTPGPAVHGAEHLPQARSRCTLLWARSRLLTSFLQPGLRSRHNPRCAPSRAGSGARLKHLCRYIRICTHLGSHVCMQSHTKAHMLHWPSAVSKGRLLQRRAGPHNRRMLGAAPGPGLPGKAGTLRTPWQSWLDTVSVFPDRPFQG